MSEYKPAIKTSTISFPIALVVSMFNADITTALKQGAIERLYELGFKESDILVYEVPGAIEIPLVLQWVAKKGKAEVLVALGAVIRGETSHYDYVCEQVSQGCQRVMMEQDIPVIFGVLTTENEDQAWDRLGGKHGHKGKEAADCAVYMQRLKEQIKSKR